VKTETVKLLKIDGVDEDAENIGASNWQKFATNREGWQSKL
jgi:hypothetical protein